MPDIPLSNLRLDTTNPRLDDGKQSQRDALRAMMEAQKEKLAVLATDIHENGLSPIDRFLVMPVEGSEGEYVVLEGNRRITALKLLANPDLGAGILPDAEIAKLKKLAAGADFNDSSEIDCVVMDSRADADHWLRIRHGGQLDGRGVVDWGATERERFEARSGRGSPELQVLALLEAQGAITTDEANAISITSLRRLLSDGAVRKKLGLEIDRKGKQVTSHYPLKESLKGLAKMAHELADPEFRVSKIYTEGDRKKFMRSFSPSDVPNPSTRLKAPVELGDSSGEGAADDDKTSRGGGRISRQRATVAPGSVKLKISQQRIKDIYRELQGLKLERFANAGAVLLRVFLELTTDSYIKKQKITVKHDAALNVKLQAVHDDLLGRTVMTKAELAPIRKAISDPGLLAASVSAMNLYVHSENLTPSPRDVRTAWDNLQLFFERIWQ